MAEICARLDYYAA